MATETPTTTAQAPATAAPVTTTAPTTPAPETKAPAAAAPEAKTPEAKATEAKAPDAKDPEKKEPAAADPKKEETKAEDPKKEQPAVPEKYELKIPEGSKIDQAEVAKVEAFAKERGLDNKAAQAVLDSRNALLTEQQSNLETMNTKTWKDELVADKEFGGTNFEESGTLAYEAVKRFGDEGFADRLKASNLNHHPDLFRLLARIGRAMSDDKFVNPNNVTKSKESDPIEKQLYPKMFEKQGA